MLCQEPGYLLRPVLEITVHDDHDVPGDGLERSCQRGLVPEVPGQLNAHHSAVACRRLSDQLERPVLAAVVHEHDLVGPAGERVEHRRYPPDQLGKDVLLVVERYRDGYPGRVHGRGKA